MFNVKTPELQKRGLTYAQLLAVEIASNRKRLKDVEGELKSRHGGWRTYYAVVRALKRMK